MEFVLSSEQIPPPQAMFYAFVTIFCHKNIFHRNVTSKKYEKESALSGFYFTVECYSHVILFEVEEIVDADPASHSSVCRKLLHID